MGKIIVLLVLVLFGYLVISNDEDASGPPTVQAYDWDYDCTYEYIKPKPLLVHRITYSGWVQNDEDAAIKATISTFDENNYGSDTFARKSTTIVVGPKSRADWRVEKEQLDPGTQAEREFWSTHWVEGSDPGTHYETCSSSVNVDWEAPPTTTSTSSDQ